MAQAQSDVKQQENNKSALRFMLVSLILFSVTPLAISLSNASSAPFLFAALLNFAGAISSLSVCIWLYHKKRETKNVKQTLQIVYSKIYTMAFLSLILARLRHVMFAFALLYINVAVGAIIMSIWPFIMVGVTALLFKKDNRYKDLGVEKWVLFMLAFVGVVFVIASQSQGVGILEIFGDLTDTGIGLGVGLVLVAALTSGIGASYSLRLGSDGSKESGGGEHDELFFTVAFLFAALVLSSAAFFALGASLNESFSDINVTITFLYGFFVQGFAVIMFRVANLRTSNLGINALDYATPVVALIWLGLASLIDIPHLDWLIIGAAAIIVANLLLNFKADNRLAYKTLVVALWLFGAIVYLTDGYESIISLEFAATIFILILAFRVDRLVRRTTDEESNTFSLFRRLDFLVEQEIINKKALGHLLTIDKQENMQKLEKAYNGLKTQLVAAKKKLTSKSNSDEREKLAEIEIQVDELAHSKQQGAHFGEIVAIGFIGAVIVSGLLFFSETNATGGAVFFVDMTSLVIASVAVFLFFNIIDLQNDRKDPILKSGKQGKMTIYEVKFDDTKDRTMNQWVSVVVSLAIIAAYGWLLWTKAVG